MKCIVSHSGRKGCSYIMFIAAAEFFVLSMVLPCLSHAQGNVLWQEDWEGDWFNNWFVDAGTWAVGQPNSGPESAFAGANVAATVLDGNYAEPVDTRLIRFTTFVVPPASENPRLRFWHWYSFNDGDDGEVQISTDGGQSWTTIFASYTWSGSGAWTRPLIDLSSYAGSTVQVAFDFHSVNVGSSLADVSSGWYIDEVELVIGPAAFGRKESFEAGLGDWAAERGTWEVGEPSAGPDSCFSPPNCAATVSNGNYAEPVDSRFVSPSYTVPADNPGLQFWHWFSFAEGDYGEVQIKVGDGPWQPISTQFTNTSSGAWSPFFIPLTDFADSRVQIAFNFHSVNVGSSLPDVSTGWYIDDIAFLPIGANLSASPNTLDYGDVLPPGSVTNEVVVTNTGADTLNVTAISILGNDASNFEVDPTPFGLAVGDTQVLEVTFSPDDFGPFQATLSIESNGGTRTVTLIGRGLSTISGDANMDGAVDAADATLTIRQLVNSATFTHPQQRINANVSPDNSVSPWDASVVLQFLAGGVQSLPSSEVALVGSGDITMTDSDVEPGQIVEVPLKLADSGDILGFDGTLSYNPADLEFEEVIWAGAFAPFSPQVHHDEDSGAIRFAGANAIPSDASSRFLTLVFRVGDNFEKNPTTISLDSLRWNEGSVVAEIAQSNLLLMTPTGIGDADAGGIPTTYALHQNYPNPFNPSTLIRFALPRAIEVRIEVYNLLGQRVAELVNGHLPAGRHEVSFDASTLSTGVYLYRIRTAEFQQIRKMLLAK